MNTPSSLMLPGDLYCVPLTNGRFGAIVLTASGAEFRFLVLDGFWDSPPTLAEISSVGLMRMYEWMDSEIFKGWFRPPFPERCVRLGHRSIEPDELSRYLDSSGTMVFQSAEDFVEVLSERWRWRFDREALTREKELLRAAYEEKERKRRENRTLKSMARERPFSHWVDQWPRATVNKAHRIIRNAAEQLIELQASPATKAEMTAVLKKITDEFNELYRQTGCIETQEREEIVDWVEQLATRVGLSNEDERLTGHRDW